MRNILRVFADAAPDKRALDLRTVRALISSAFVVSVLAGGVAAAESPGADVDGLIACSIVYQQVAELYAEINRPIEQRSFVETSTAYSASALHALGYSLDVASAIAHVDARVPEVVEALTLEASRADDGEQEVIAAWLPYCDSLGAEVSRMLIDREYRGW